MSRVTRNVSVSLFLAAGLMFPRASAVGGGAPLQFDQRYYVPGEVARGSTTFGKGSVGLHMMDRGPFYAYLLTGGHIDPPRIPRGAIPLGPIAMTPIDEHTFRASLSFTVPEVASGAHIIEYCNDPCTLAGVGELWGGAIQVYASADEARTEMAIAHLKGRLRQIRTNHRFLKRRVEERREELERDLAAARASNESLAQRVQQLDGELDAVRAPDREPNWPAIAGWTLFGLLVVANLGLAAVRIRRRRRPAGTPLRRRTVEAPRPPRDLEPVP